MWSNTYGYCQLRKWVHVCAPVPPVSERHWSGSLCLGLRRSHSQRDPLLELWLATRVEYAICIRCRGWVLCPAELLGMLKGWNKCFFFFNLMSIIA